jgi:hypothetical protein
MPEEGRDADAGRELVRIDRAPQHRRRSGADPERPNAPGISPLLGAHIATDIGQVGCPATICALAAITSGLPPTVEIEGDHRQSGVRGAGTEFCREGKRLPVSGPSEAHDEHRHRRGPFLGQIYRPDIPIATWQLGSGFMHSVSPVLNQSHGGISRGRAPDQSGFTT